MLACRQEYDQACLYFVEHDTPIPTSTLPEPGRFFAERLAAVYAELTGCQQDEAKAEVSMLLAFGDDATLPQKREEFKQVASKQRKAQCVSVLVVEMLASSGEQAIPLRWLRAMSDICQIWRICMIVDEAMTGIEFPCLFNCMAQSLSCHAHVELCVCACAPGFRTAPTAFLCRALGIQNSLVTFSKAVYPAGVGACLHAGGAFTPADYARLYPSRTSFISLAAAQELQAVLEKLTPDQMKRNFFMGRWLRARLRSMLPQKCTRSRVRGLGMLVHTTVDLAQDNQGVSFQYNRLLPPFDVTLARLDAHLRVRGAAFSGIGAACSVC